MTTYLIEQHLTDGPVCHWTVTGETPAAALTSVTEFDMLATFTDDELTEVTPGYLWTTSDGPAISYEIRAVGLAATIEAGPVVCQNKLERTEPESLSMVLPLHLHVADPGQAFSVALPGVDNLDDATDEAHITAEKFRGRRVEVRDLDGRTFFATEFGVRAGDQTPVTGR